MKKFLLFLMFIATPAYAIESAVIGTMLKQDGTVISPADDVTEFDVSGITCTGCGGGVEEGADVGFGNITATSLYIPLGGSAVAPTLNWGSAGTGYWTNGNNQVRFSVGGAQKLIYSSGGLSGTTGTFELDFTTDASATHPSYAFKDDTDTGIGSSGDGQVSIIADSVEAMRNYTTYTEFYPSGAGQVKIYDTGTLEVPSGIVFSGQTTILSNYSATINDYTIFADATAGPFTVVVDATTAKGHHVRIKKTDSTANAITVDGLSAQTIDGALTYIIREGALMLVSDGANWEKVQATPVAFYADMHVHENISTTVISTQDSPHHVRQFNLEDAFGLTFTEGSIGSISAFTEYSTVVTGTTKVTDADHGLVTGDILTINGTTSYNGIFEATFIDSSNYYIEDTFVADDATGDWVEGDYLMNDPGTNGVYKLEFHGFGMPDAGTNQDYEFEIFNNTVPVENLEAKRRFSNSSDIGTFGGGGIVTLADGDRVSFTIIPLSGTQDFTLEHLNIALHRIR